MICYLDNLADRSRRRVGAEKMGSPSLALNLPKMGGVGRKRAGSETETGPSGVFPDL
jgi:hypothetical protein